MHQSGSQGQSSDYQQQALRNAAMAFLQTPQTLQGVKVIDGNDVSAATPISPTVGSASSHANHGSDRAVDAAAGFKQPYPRFAPPATPSAQYKAKFSSEELSGEVSDSSCKRRRFPSASLP